MSFQPKTLITGANGFIGGALVAKLLARNEAKDTIFLIRSSKPEEGLMRLVSTLTNHGITSEQLLQLKLEQILCGDLNVVNHWISDPRLKSVENVVSSAARCATHLSFDFTHTQLREGYPPATGGQIAKASLSFKT